MGGAAAAAAAGFLKLNPAHAQDATPVATPVVEGLSFPGLDLPAIPPEFDAETNWPVEGADLQGTRIAKGSNISTSTVSGLTEAWVLPIDAPGATFGALVANPIVVDGVIYLQSGTSDIYAISLDSGEIIWSKIYNQLVPTGGPNGVAVAYGNVYAGVGGEGMVVALDAATGDEVWSRSIQGMRYEGTDMAPSVRNGLVYISTIPGNLGGFYQFGQRGVLYALDALTGDTYWIFDTVVDNLWNNSLVNSGGGLWHPVVFDADGNPFIGVANASPFPGTEEYPWNSSRPDANDYANNVIRIDPHTAGISWATNVNPSDDWDLDQQLSPVIVDYTNADGHTINYAIASGKHGFVIALERSNGKEYWRTPVGKHQNELLDGPPADGADSIEVWPGTLGGVEMPFAVTADKVIVQVNNNGATYTATETNLDFLAGTSAVIALDLLNGSHLWEVELPTGGYGGITIANDVAFTAGLDGVVRGINIEDGSIVWSSQTAAGINTTFAISGDTLLVPSGGIFVESSDSVSPAPEFAPALYAYKLS